MINTILDALSIPHKESHFRKQPTETFLVYYDNPTRRGADVENCITEHNYSFELYEYEFDDAAEAEVEAALDACAIEWEKTGRQWLNNEQVYMTIYDFSYTTKGAL